nr:hypothetical protein [[Limnothrix rosea] IAM M-220]
MGLRQEGDVMELAPIAGHVVSEYTAAKLVYKLIGYWHEKNFREQW